MAHAALLVTLAIAVTVPALGFEWLSPNAYVSGIIKKESSFVEGEEGQSPPAGQSTTERCIRNGQYSNPDDCGSYIQCSNGLQYIMPCPLGLHYSEETQRCESKCDAHCDETLACDCKWESCKGTCALPKDEGPCFGHFLRYYFNKDTGQCQEFIYGGCKGNLNNYKTIQECEKACTKREDSCSLPKYVGPCKGYVPRYYFNQLSGRCEEFIYGGCEGNSNNFEIKEQCEKMCESSNDYSKKASKNPTKSFLTEDFACIKDGFYRNPEDCKSYIHCSNGQKYVQPCPSGLHFSVETERCESPCEAYCDQSIAEECGWLSSVGDDICNLPPEYGPCDKHEIKWYYNRRVGECHRFTYGGCGGNANRFNGKLECYARCSHARDPEWTPSLSDLIAQNFTCILDGEYENPEDCSTFIQCSNRPPYVQPCPAGLHFSQKTKRCESPCDAECDKSLAEECGWNEYVTRGSVLTPSKVYLIAQDFTCILDGVYKNPEDCSTFIQCSNGLPYVQPCPAGLHFSQETERCESPCEAECDENLAEQCGWNEDVTRMSSADDICRLLPDKGRCDVFQKRWYFDSSMGECREFFYSGCRGNANNFRSKRDCENRCLRVLRFDKESFDITSYAPFTEPFTEDDECVKDGLYTNSENCSTFIQCSNGQSYVQPCSSGLHFSEETERCESPCKAHCDDSLGEQCGWTKQLPRGTCHLPYEVGPCQARMPRFFFDTSKRECRLFYYGGCKGNANNFRTMDECEGKCSSFKDHQISADDSISDDFNCTKDGLYQNPENCTSFIQCSNGLPYVQLCRSGLHFSVETQRCESPCDAHCDQGIADECGWEEKNTKNGFCQLPYEVGPCRARIPRFYYDVRKGSCMPFYYGGCKGNSNNFRTMKECQEKCFSFENHCNKDGLYQNPGDCKSFIHCSNGKSYVQLCPSGLHFSVETERCESPCDAHCDQSISDECGWDKENRIIDVCYMHAEKGPCKSSFKRYYYDFNTKSCTKFEYGGCEGNANNFNSLEDCRNRCPDTGDYSRKSLKFSTGDFEDFTCVKDGLFHEPEDCESYIQCSNGQKYVRPCPSGLHFSVETQRCESPCDAHCDQSIAQECGWNEYIKPTEYSWFKFRNIPDSNQQIPTEDPITMSSEFNCIKDGLYPDPKDCERFIQCTNGWAVGMPCPRGLHFSEKSQRCESSCDAHCNTTIACQCGWPECSEIDVDCEAEPLVGPCKGSIRRYFYDRDSGRCKRFTYGGCGGNTNNFLTEHECSEKCQKKLVGDYRCPSPYGKFANFFDCVSYYECKRDNPIIKRCPSGTAFDHIKSKCVSEATVRCMFTCQEQDSVYSYLPDCSKYIECVNGINKPKKCPPGQVFDRRIKSCADENTVPCPKY